MRFLYSHNKGIVTYSVKHFSTLIVVQSVEIVGKERRCTVVISLNEEDSLPVKYFVMK